MAGVEKEINPEEEKPHDEHWRLAGRPPLVTILFLAIGPLISQVSSALDGIFDTMWVAKGVGTFGVSVISTYAPFDSLTRGFGYFLSAAAGSKISSLLGSGKGEEAPQLMVDVLRVALIIGVLLPAAVLPWVKYAAAFAGASQEVVDQGFHYISITLGASVVSLLYLSIEGCLQGEGRTMISGIASAITCVVNIAALDPAIIVSLGLGVRGAALATVLSDFLPFSVLATMYFMGKFSVKPKFSMFFKKFGPNITASLKVGGSLLVSQLSKIIPAALIVYFTGTGSGSVADYTSLLSCNNVCLRLYAFNMAIMASVTHGYIPAASYAYANENKDRMKWLTIHAFWINCSWGMLISLIEVIIPRYVAMIFSKDALFLSYAERGIRYSNYAYCLTFVRVTCQSLLQAMQLGTRAMVLGVISQFASLIGFALMWHFIFPTQPVYYQLTYSCSYVVGLILAIALCLNPLRKILGSAEKEQHFEAVP